MHDRRNKHPVCLFKRRSEAQYSRIAIMDDGKSDVGHDGTGCTLLDNAGAYCPDRLPNEASQQKWNIDLS